MPSTTNLQVTPAESLLMLVICFLFVLFLLWAVRFLPKPIVPVDGCWEAVPDTDNTPEEGMYRVRWSVPDSKGRYLWVRHYGYGKNRSRGWAQHAASRNAEEFNKVGRLP